jgi:cell division protein ZapA
MDGEPPRVTAVKIYNRTYQVSSGGDPEHVRRLAEYVDETMNEVVENTSAVDSLKVAVLAALNIANDYFAARRELEHLEHKVASKSQRIKALLDSFDESPSARDGESVQ